MEVNYYGFSLLILGILLVAIIKKLRFVDLYIFFIPFTSTAVIFAGDSAVNLPLFLFFLAFFSYFLNSFIRGKITYPKASLINLIWIAVIGFIAIVSEIMPFIINGDYLVLDRYSSLVFYAKEIPLVPSFQWITQLLYFLIGLATVFLIIVTYRTKQDFKKMFKFLFYGIIFMIFWGWVEYFCYYTGITYPYEIFDHIGISRRGTLISGNFPRISSVTLEPSYLAQTLIPVIPFFYWFSQEKQRLVFNKDVNKFLYGISLITLIIAKTSTGILGFLFLIGFLLKSKLKNFSKQMRILLILGFLIMCVFAIVFIIIVFIEKSKNYSGIERLITLDLGAKYFSDYPLLGLGWGVFPTYEFLINLLVNFGLLGTMPFMILLYNIYKGFIRNIKYNDENKNLYRAGLESFIMILIVSQLSGFIYHSQYFWIYLGIALSISIQSKIKTEVK